MRQYLDGDDVFAEIMMMFQVDRRITILVEGSEDAALIDPHINDLSCRSQIAYGKEAVLRAAQLAQAQGMQRVFAAVDRDFDRHEDLVKFSSRISISEYHDLEVDILMNCPYCLKRLLYSHADRTKVIKYIGAQNTSVPQIAFAIAGHVGTLRLASVKQQLGLHLHNFPMAPLIEAFESGGLPAKIVRIAAARSRNCSLSDADLVLILEKHLEGSVFESVSSGHDTINLLSAFIRERWGGVSGSDALGRAFRSSVDWECFSRLRIYVDFRNWGNDLGENVWERDIAS